MQFRRWLTYPETPVIGISAIALLGVGGAIAGAAVAPNSVETIPMWVALGLACGYSISGSV